MALVKIPTLTEQLSVVRKRILTSRSNTATQPGSIVSSVFIVPQAVSDVRQAALNYLTTIAFSIPDLLALKRDSGTMELLASALQTTTSDLLTQISLFIDTHGRNVKESRKPPTKASGSVVFGRINPPTSNTTIGVGKVVKAGNGQQYVTTSAVTMYSASAGSYFDPELLMYTLRVPVEASQEGDASNAEVGTINSMVSSVDGFNYVTNTTYVGDGRDLESDEDFGSRIVARLQAVGALTRAGVKATIMDNINSVITVNEVTSSDSLSTRGSAKTDLWIQGQKIVQVTETFNSFNAPEFPNGIRVSKLPLIDVASVSSGKFIIRKDTSSVIRGSVRARDVIQFTTAPVFPLTITYTYDGAVEESQNLFEDDKYTPTNYITPDSELSAIKTPILVKAGIRVGVDYTATITAAPGYSKPQVVNDILVALSEFASTTFRMGETIYIGDFDKVVEGVEGVLRISGEPTRFNISSAPGVVSEISFASNEYPFLNIINIF